MHLKMVRPTSSTLLVLVCMLAAFLRLYHLGYGIETTYPQPVYDLDEYGLVDSIYGMLLSKSLDPHLYVHPNFSQYLILFVLLPFRSIVLQGNAWMIVMTSRIIIAAFGTASVVLTYLLAKSLYKRESSALLAGLVLALSVYHIRESRFYMADVIQTFFLIIALRCIYAIMQGPTLKNYLLSGVAIGFALAAKQTSILMIPLLAATHFFLTPRRPLWQKAIDKKLYVAALIPPFILFATSPFSLLYFREFLKELVLTSLEAQKATVLEWHMDFLATRPLLDDIRNLFWGMGPAFALAIVGLIYGTYKRREGDKLLLLYLLICGPSIVLTYSKYSRYYVPLLPALSILAGDATIDIYRNLSRPLARRTWQTASCALVFLGLLYALAFVNVYSDKDHRAKAREWLIANIKTPSVIYAADKSHLVPQGFDPAGIHDVRKIELADLIDRNEKYRNVPRLSRLLDWCQRRGIYTEWNRFDRRVDERGYFDEILSSADYIVETDFDLKKYTAVRELCPEQYRFYKRLFDGKAGFTLVKEFHNVPRLFGFEIPMQNTDICCRYFDQGGVYIFKADRRSP